MDAALLRERELFKKRALATPVVENTKRKERDVSQDEENARKKSKPTKASTVVKTDASNYKTMTGSSQYKFGVLAKIVKFMKIRYQDGDDHPLTLDEILDETNQLDVGSKVKQWLLTEALASNPKIEVLPDGRYQFKPPFRIRDKKGLLRLLKQHDLKGYGGIYLDDIQESLPHFEKAMKSIANEIITITRPIDKKKVIFYHDRAAALPVDDEFQKLWRAVAIDGIDDEKIQEYLEKQGIRSMQESNLKKTMNPAKRRKAAAKKKQFRKPRDNEHLADVLEVYENT